MSKAQLKNKKVVVEEDSSSEEEVQTTKKQKTTVGAAKAAPAKAVNKKKVESESEEDEIILPAKGKNAQKTAAKTDAKAKQAKVVDSDSSESSLDEAEFKGKKGAAPTKAAPAKGKAAAKKQESSDDEEEPVAPPKKAAQPAKTTKAPVKKVESSDEESEEEVKPAKKAAPAAKKPAAAPAKKTPTVDDSVSDDESEEEVKPVKKAAPATTTKTTKAPAKKVESSDEEDSEEEVKPTKKAAPATKAPAKKVQEEEEEEEDEEEEKQPQKPLFKSAAQAAPATEEKKFGSNEVFVKNLPFAASQEDLKGIFAECGTIENVNLLTGPDGRSKGIAFIRFTDDAGVVAACKWNGTDFQGRNLVVEKTLPKENRPAKGSVGAGGAREFPKTERDPNSASIFVGNLSYQTTEDSLHDFFAPCGKISGLRIAMGEDGRPRGFAHVDFESPESVDKAMSKLGSDLDGRAVRIDYSAGRKNNAGGGFGGNRGGFGGGNRGGFGGGNRGFGGGNRMNLSEEDASKKKGSISSFQGQKQRL